MVIWVFYTMLPVTFSQKFMVCLLTALSKSWWTTPMAPPFPEKLTRCSWEATRAGHGGRSPTCTITTCPWNNEEVRASVKREDFIPNVRRIRARADPESAFQPWKPPMDASKQHQTPLSNSRCHFLKKRRALGIMMAPGLDVSDMDSVRQTNNPRL